jgi:hypothetical protein
MFERTDNPWRVFAEEKRAQIYAWRTKAEELREIAMSMNDVDSRRRMLNAADNYDRFAAEADQDAPPKSLIDWMEAN